MSNEKNYGESHIQVLEGLEAVRLRPEMYIGSREERGLHHLVWEVVDNSIDEHMAGYCDKIDVTIHKDNSITVSDNGRGIPIGMHETENKSTLEVVLTVLHAGGKFGEDSPYKSAGGLHGVGLACVNALSGKAVATVKRDGKVYEAVFEKGAVTSETKVVGKCNLNETGTSIWFSPDNTIFEGSMSYDYETIYNRLRESSFLNGGLSITLIDEREVEGNKRDDVTFYFENGMKDFVAHLNKKRTPLTDEIFHFSQEKDDVLVEVAFQYTNSHSETTLSFANNIKTNEGGTHETGYRSGITQVIKQVIDSRGLLKEDEGEPLTGDDIRTGLVSVISVKVPDPQFEGQTKNKLSNAEIRSIVQGVIQESFSKILADNPRFVKPITDKIVNSYQERLSVKRARQAIRRENRLEGSSFTLPEKLADCRQDTPVESRELFIVEGDSAGGSAKTARDNVYQAVLPLRGKVLNVEKASLDKVSTNNEIEDMRASIGTGYGENFKYEDLRYDKVIIMTDADIDGEHIQILLLTFFYRYMRALVERGHIYIAQPPLYGLVRNGKVIKYIDSEEELEEEVKNNPRASVQRYKGLGEMNADQLWDTTMDPKYRRLSKMSIEDVEEADRIFETLMGSDPSSRKQYIEVNGHKADIDI